MEKYVVAIGNPGVDHYYRCENWPVLGDKARVYYVESVVGGMIANAGCILARYGVKTYLFTQLGDDEFLPLIQEDLARYGLDLHYVTVESGMANNQNFIMLAESEKTIFLVQSDKPTFRLTERQQALLESAAYVYTTIADLKRIHDHYALLDRLTKAGVGIFLDVESEALAGAEEDAAFLQAATMISFNGPAFAKFLASAGGDDVWRRLRQANDKIVVVTKGEEGCTVYCGDTEFSVDAWRVIAVDTTGAGDTFNASLLYGHLQGWDLQEAARFATAAAARSITVMGPKAGAVPVDEVFHFMKG